VTGDLADGVDGVALGAGDLALGLDGAVGIVYAAVPQHGGAGGLGEQKRDKEWAGHGEMGCLRGYKIMGLQIGVSGCLMVGMIRRLSGGSLKMG
jgi:hypothetical protein